MIIKLKLLPHAYKCWQHWKTSCRNSTLQEAYITLIAIHLPIPRKVLHILSQQSLAPSHPQAKSTSAGGEGDISKLGGGFMYAWVCMAAFRTV